MASGPTIEQLRRETQDRPDRHDFYMWGVARKLSVYVTWLAVRTPITPNQVTAIGIIFGVFGALMFSFPNPMFWVLGWLAANVYFILDQTDGEVARYKRMTTKFGYFLDEISHPIVNNALFLAAGLGLYASSGSVQPLIVGLAALFFASLLRFVGAYSDFVKKTMLKLRTEKIEMSRSWLKRAAGIPMGLGGYFHILFLAAVLDALLPMKISEWVLPISSFRELFLVVITAAMPLIAAWKITTLGKTLKGSKL